MGLIGVDGGKEKLGKLPLRRRGLCDLLDLDLGLGIRPGLDRQGIESPEPKDRVVQPAEFAKTLARDRVPPRRRVGQRPGQRTGAASRANQGSAPRPSRSPEGLRLRDRARFPRPRISRASSGIPRRRLRSHNCLGSTRGSRPRLNAA